MSDLPDEMTDSWQRFLDKQYKESNDVWQELILDIHIYGVSQYHVDKDGKVTRIPPQDWKNKTKISGKSSPRKHKEME